MSQSKLTIKSVEEALQLQSAALGVTDWYVVEQKDVNVFGLITKDQQWIHVDPVKANDGPFGGCIAHGLYTLSLAGGYFFQELVDVRSRMGINYGCNRVRYPSPLLVGSFVRGSAVLKSSEAIGEGGVQMVVEMTVDIRGEKKPACVAEFVVRYFF